MKYVVLKACTTIVAAGGNSKWSIGAAGTASSWAFSLPPHRVLSTQPPELLELQPTAWRRRSFTQYFVSSTTATQRPFFKTSSFFACRFGSSKAGESRSTFQCAWASFRPKHSWTIPWVPSFSKVACRPVECLTKAGGAVAVAADACSAK